MVAGWRGWANLSRPGGVLLTVQELSNPRPRLSLSLSTAVFSRYIPAPEPPPHRAILILLFSTFDTRNSEIIEVVAVARKLCVKYVGDVDVLSHPHPVRKNESNFSRAKHHGIRCPMEPVAFLPRHNWLLSLPIAVRSNASIADDTRSFVRILKKFCFIFAN